MQLIRLFGCFPNIDAIFPLWVSLLIFCNNLYVGSLFISIGFCHPLSNFLDKLETIFYILGAHAPRVSKATGITMYLLAREKESFGPKENHGCTYIVQLYPAYKVTLYYVVALS